MQLRPTAAPREPRSGKHEPNTRILSRRLVSAVLAAIGSQVLLGTTIAAPPAEARTITYELDIPSQDLNSALQQFALASKHKLFYKSDIVEGKISAPLRGKFTTDEAVQRLLAGTDLTYDITPSAVVLIRDKTDTPITSAEDANRAKEGKKSSSGEFRLAQVDQRAAARTSAVASAEGTESDDGGRLEEVIVTAQKREERLHEVPVPVSAISAQTLVDTNRLRLQDYYSMIPGLSVTPADTRGTPVLAIRGVTTGGSFNPTVGITLDDVPYGSSIVFGGGFAAPDLDPSDLARIEVLRGPQGTLYGASSIGGLLKFVTLEPSTAEGVSGHVQAGTNGVQNGEAAGYSARGAVNIPLSDSCAVRASGFAREDPGYIDNVLTGERGVNRFISDGGHFSALWRSSDTVSVKLSALFQHASAHGASEVDLEEGLRDLQQSRVRGTGGYDRKDQAYSATLTAKLGKAELTVLSGYGVNTYSDSQDFTSVFGQLLTEPVFGVTGTPTAEHGKLTKFTQEVRLSTSIGPKLDWLLGAFYTHEDSHFVQDIFAADPVTGATFGEWSDDVLPSTYMEYATFTDLTYRVTDRVDVQIGGREGENKQSYAETITGPLDAFLYPPPAPVINPQVHTKDNSFTYLVTPRFKITPDLMAYARLASGYRPGGPNSLSTVFGAPPSYKPDTTRNYEVGVKGAVLDRSLSFDASLYYVNWKDIQLAFVDPRSGAGYFINGSGARSQGVELSVESRPLTGLTISAWIAWNDAALTRDLPPGGLGTPVGASGGRLPGSSRFSGNLSLEQDFALTSSTSAIVGATVSYVGDRVGIFTVAPQRQDLPGFARADLRAGIKHESWTGNLYVTNITDKRGLLTGGLGTFNPNAFTYIQPRVIGVSVDKAFGR